MAKGSSVAGVGTAMALLFAGGAAGKFACGLVAERLGVIRTVVLTEGATALGILAIIAAPLPLALAMLPLIGVALNGTSSVLYGTVADLVNADRRSRAYGLYYTTTIAASALAPSLYGILGDLAGVPFTLVIVAAIVLTTIPLCLALRASVAADTGAGGDRNPVVGAPSLPFLFTQTRDRGLIKEVTTVLEAPDESLWPVIKFQVQIEPGRYDAIV